MHHRARVVLRERVAPQRLALLVRAALLPGQRREYGEERDGEDARRPRREWIAPFSRQAHDPGNDQHDQPDAREILPVIGDEGEPEEVDLDEAEDWEQRTAEVENRDERTPAQSAARLVETDEDRNRRQREHILPML